MGNNNTIIVRQNLNDITDKNFVCSHTSEEKWWSAVVLGFIFFLLANAYTYKATSNLLVYFHGMETCESNFDPQLVLTLLHTLIFIFIVRLILQ